jgi:hypothetical protein
MARQRAESAERSSLEVVWVVVVVEVEGVAEGGGGRLGDWMGALWPRAESVR